MALCSFHKYCANEKSGGQPASPAWPASLRTPLDVPGAVRYADDLGAVFEGVREDQEAADRERAQAGREVVPRPAHARHPGEGAAHREEPLKEAVRGGRPGRPARYRARCQRGRAPPPRRLGSTRDLEAPTPTPAAATRASPPRRRTRPAASSASLRGSGRYATAPRAPGTRPRSYTPAARRPRARWRPSPLRACTKAKLVMGKAF